MKLELLAARLAVCRLPADAEPPDWATAGAFWSMTRTTDELSIVAEEGAAPPEVEQEGGWRALKVAGPLDFALVGVLADLAAPLAAAGVSIFVMSTFDTDYVLVKQESVARAAEALEAAGHSIS